MAGHGNSDFDRGWNRSGPANSGAEQAGQIARERQDREREEARQRHIAADAEITRRMWQNNNVSQNSGSAGIPSSNAGSRASASASAPSTFAGTVKGFAVAGAVLALLYAYLGLNLTTLPRLGIYALEGAVAGAVAGAVVHLAVLAIRLALKVVWFVLRVAAAVVVLYFAGILLLQFLR